MSILKDVKSGLVAGARSSLLSKILYTPQNILKKSFGSFSSLETNPRLWSLANSPSITIEIPHNAYSQQVAQYISWVYRCSRVCQRGVSSVNHRLLYWNDREQAELELTDHPWLDLVDRINQDQTLRELVEETIMRMDLNGLVYWYPEVNERLKVIKSIIAIEAANMKPETKNGEVIYYSCEDERIGRVKLYPDQVIPFYEINPANRTGGYSKVSAVGYTLKLMAEARMREYMTLKNLKRPDFGLIPEAGNLNSQQIKDLRNQFFETMSDQGTGLPIVLAGIKGIETWQFSSRDLHFLKGLHEIKEEICAIWGVPLVFIIPDDANRANIEGYEYLFQKYTIHPLVEYFEGKINQRIMPLYGQYIYARYDEHIPENKDQILKERESNIKSGYSLIDQERAKAGEEPLPNGLGSVAWRSSTEIPYSKVGQVKPDEETPPPAEPTPPPPIEEDIEEREEDEEEEKSTGPKVIHYKADKSDRILKTLVGQAEKNNPYAFSNEDIEGIVGNSEEKLSKIWKDTYQDITDKAVELLDKVTIPLVKKAITTSQKNAIDEIVRQLETEGWETIVDEKGGVILEGIYRKAGQVGASKVQIGLSFDVYNPEALAQVEAIRESFSVTPTATAIEDVRKVISTGIEEGRSIKEIQRAMRQNYDDIWKARADLIADVETKKAVNMGHLQSWKQSGVITKKVFITSLDDRVCEFCYSLDGTEVGLDVPFLSQGDTIVTENEEGNQVSFTNTYEDSLTPPIHPRSYDKETDIYTDSGWKKVSEVKVGEKCLSLNIETIESEWVEVKQTFKHKEEWMISFFGEEIDLVVTLDHDMVYCERDKISIVKAVEFMKKNKSGSLLTSVDTWRNHFTVSIKNLSIKRMSYNDFAYCVELEKNHTLFVRRNGKTCWSGNCRCTIGGRP